MGSNWSGCGCGYKFSSGVRRKDYIVISQSMNMLSAVMEAAIATFSISIFRYDGSMTTTARDTSLANFRACEDVAILLLSKEAGGVGLAIPEASQCVLTEPGIPSSINKQLDRGGLDNETLCISAGGLVTTALKWKCGRPRLGSALLPQTTSGAWRSLKRNRRAILWWRSF